jgi:predicted nucleic-acid-binding protein
VRGLDTNVLVRYLVADDITQTAMAAKVVEDTRAAGELLFFSVVVLCELVWVLTRSYRRDNMEVIEILDLILRTKPFQVENDALVRRSLDAFRTGRGDFADYLIGEMCLDAGCQDCITFDRALRDAAGFTLLH